MLHKKDIPGAVFNPGTQGYTVELSAPVEHGGRTVERLDMRPAIVNDVLEAQRLPGGNADHEMALFARLCGVEPALIARLHFADYGALQEVYGDFLGSRRRKFARPASLSPDTPDGAGAPSE